MLELFFCFGFRYYWKNDGSSYACALIALASVGFSRHYVKVNTIVNTILLI